MDYTMSEWNGFQRADFSFEGRDALIVFPNVKKNGRWMMKMEYFGAFPNLEIELLSRGWHLAYLKNANRWGRDEDQDLKARLADFLSAEFGLEKRFTCVGMSLGGLHSVYFAARHPDYVSCLYLDAPVMNLLSYPLGFGAAAQQYPNGSAWPIINELFGQDSSTILTWRGHPMDQIPILMEHKFPVALIYGDADPVVPYRENGLVLEEAYKKAGLPLFCVGKKGCGHHPHGLEDPTPLADFIEANAL